MAIHMRWDKKLDILGPIHQAERCLDVWLKGVGRRLTRQQKQRAAALMARYFHNEDQVTDQLMLSFLRHYSGQHEVDMEDPASVRSEIKAVLDQTAAKEAKNWWRAAVAALLVVAFGFWLAGQRQITEAQGVELKSLVHQVVMANPQTTNAAVWADIKGRLNVRRYQEMSWWNYLQSRAILEKKLSASCARM